MSDKEIQRNGTQARYIELLIRQLHLRTYSPPSIKVTPISVNPL